MRILLIFILTLSASKLFATQAEDVDYISLAKVLLRDGLYQRAKITLDKVQEVEDDEKPVFFFLKGMISLNGRKYSEALELFDRSLKLDSTLTEVHLYRAEALLKLEKVTLAEQALLKTPKELKDKLSYYILLGEVLWKSGKKSQAFTKLNEVLQKGLAPGVLSKKKFSWLMEEQLYVSAQALAFDLIIKPERFQDVLAMASQLRVAKQFNLSLEVLQALSLLRPEKEVVALEMAQNYISLGEKYSAALVLEEAARLNPSLNYEASELLRQNGKNYRSQYLNISITDQEKQLKQKLALYLEDDDYHSLKYMIPQLRQSQLLKDEEIRYAVAYSLFRTGDFERSKEFLKRVTKDGLFEKSIELRREIDQCKTKKWACVETI